MSSVEKYDHRKEESEIVISEDAGKSSTETLGYPHFPDYSDLADEMPEYDLAASAGALWFRQEIDRSVLEKLIKMAEEFALRKKVLGKPTRKKFGIRKYRKYAGSPRK